MSTGSFVVNPPAIVDTEDTWQHVRHASLPTISLLSWDPEQRKSLIGIHTLPAPQVVQIKTESGEPDKGTHRASQNQKHRVSLGRY